MNRVGAVALATVAFLSTLAVPMPAVEPAFAGKITVTSVDGQPLAGSIKLGATAEAELSGEVVGLKGNAREYAVQATIYRLYDRHWWAAGTGKLEPAVSAKPRASRSYRWTIRGVSFPSPDYGKGYEIRVILVRRERGEPSEGLVDYGELQRRALAFTAPIQGTIGNEGTRPKVPCHVEIVDIRGVEGGFEKAPPGNRTPIEVGLDPDVRGKVVKEPGAYEYLVVQAVNDSQKWVMPRKGTRHGEFWSETAYIGRPEVDTAERFRVQAIISKKPLRESKDRNSSYSPQVWRQVERDLCARSAEVLVRRGVHRGDLVIETVDETDVHGKGPYDVPDEFQVSGGMQDPQPGELLGASGPETVWILSKPVRADGWKVHSLAIVLDDRIHWRVPSLRFDEEGTHRLLAVAATTKLRRGQILSDDHWYDLVSQKRLRRLSRVVLVKVPSETPAVYNAVPRTAPTTIGGKR